MIVKTFGIDFDSHGRALTLNEWEVTESPHKDGWRICGVVHEDYFEWVNEFEAIHNEYGFVFGNFEDKVYASSQEGFNHFMKNHAPHEWDYSEI